MQKAISKYWPVFVLPTLLAFIIGFIWPFIWGIYLSFQRFTTVSKTTFVGFDNYIKVFQDATFTHAFWFTAAFTVVSTVLINVFAFAIALALTRGIRGTNLFRTVYFMPNLIGGILLGYIWQILLNGVLANLGKPLLALDERYGFIGLVILMCWQQIGYMMIIYVAGLQSVPGDLIEAAKIDGATGREILFKIKVPLVMPSITICTFLTLTNSQPERDAGPQHLLHLLRPQRRPVEGHRPGQGRGLFPDRRRDLAGAAPLHPLEGGAVLMAKTKRLYNTILTVVMSILCLLWVYPVVLIFLNSLKVEGSFTTSTVFALPTAENFAGAANYIYGIVKMDFLSSFFYSLVITVTSVFLILLCCSMCGWYLTRVNNLLSKGMNLLIVFSMVVPFQMVMFTLSKTADTLKLNTPWNICIIYLGFGAGLAVFMFTGFMKSVPIEIEESAMIDGCNPVQLFFRIVFPILKPTMISTAILETMWVWNDYLLPTLVLDIKKYRTIPMAIQYFRGGYGRVELAPMMACIIIAIVPIIILYVACQKYIIEGVIAGAVKG